MEEVAAFDPASVRATVDSIKLGLALAAACILAWNVIARRRGASVARQRLRDALLIAVAVGATASWWNFFQFHYGGPTRALPQVHDWDTYHYYVGSKYFEELEYVRLYSCTAAADLESPGWERVAGRPIRDLATNTLEPSTSTDTSACKTRFSGPRWQEFKADVSWFRNRIPGWDMIFIDWGFNATPVWTALGMKLAETGRATDRQIKWLTLLDIPLLAAGFASVAWAFGWRTLCVILVFWGTCLPGEYSWTGGAFLRHPWFALLLGGISLLRRRHAFAGGFALGSAALLRVFPGAVFVGLALMGVLRLVRRTDRAAQTRTLRTAAGALSAAALLLSLSAPSTGGLATWVEFAHNSAIDSVPSVNNLGLKGVLAHRDRDKWAILDGVPRAAERWKTARAETLASRWHWRIAGIALGTALLAAAALRRPDDDWIAAVLGIGIIPIVFHLSGYYHVCIVVFGLLATQRAWIAVALCVLAAFSQALGRGAMELDELYVWLSVGWLAFVGFASLLLCARDSPVVSEWDVFSSEDAIKGPRAFIEKRKP